ncbi:Sau3AI family type II restriction endonuclease [Lactobacillaceae bacterium Scapto_B20]
MSDIRKKYTSKEEVHHVARQIKDIKQPDLVKMLGTNLVGKKNAMGDIFESWFGKQKDNDNEPDLGVVELKATPFKQNKNGKFSAKERLVLTMINFESVINETFENSHLYHKNKDLEIAFYQAYRNGDEKIPVSERFFKYIALYQMQKSPKDFKIIKHDFQTIQSMVKEGNADKLSESLTDILGACPKGRNSKDTTKQPYSDKPAMRRAFSLKRNYMDLILQDVIKDDHDDERSEAIIQHDFELDNKSLDEIILERLNKYVGFSQSELMEKFKINSKSKNKNNLLIKAMLGIDSKNGNLDNVDELKKASIVPKTIQFDHKNYNKDSMSLPSFKFKDLVEQKWVDYEGQPLADLNTYLSESKFVFVVFKYDTKEHFDNRDPKYNFFKGAKFFSVPVDQLNGTIENAWEETKHTLLSGVNLVYSGGKTKNNFIGVSDHKIIHVRPHTSKSRYVKCSDTNQLPVPANWTNKPAEYSDDYMTTQSFWLDNYYVRDAVKDLLD